MLFRIGVALTALSLAHGADQSAADLAAASNAIRQQVPAGMVELCLDNAALCQSIAKKAASELTSSPSTAGQSSLPTSASELAMPVMHFPLPPRRPAMDGQRRAEGLDREGLIRALNARG